MATLQANLTNTTTPFYLNGGPGLIWDSETIVTDGAGVAIAQYTVMAYNPTTKKWDPFTALTGTDGTAWPAGIYIGQGVTAAAIQAGDVEGVEILVGANVGLQVDEAKLVFEAGTLDLDSLCGPNVPAAGDRLMTCRQALHELNIYPQPTREDFQVSPVA